MQFADDRRVVVGERNAIAVTQRRIGFRCSRERDAFNAVLLLQLLVIERALNQTHLLALELVPAFQILGLLRHDVRARRVIVGLDDVDGLAPLGRVAHRCDHQIDLALLQELDAIRCDDGRQLDLHTKALRHVGRKIRLEADDLAGRIEIPERPVIALGAYYEDTFLLDVLQYVRVRGAHPD